MRVPLLACAFLLAALQAIPAFAVSDGQRRAQDAGRALLGTAAPRLVLTTIDGETIDLGALYGKKAVYLKFWATWCVPCRQQMPHFEHVFETAGADLAVVAIDVGFNDSVDAIRRFREKIGITMPIVFDDGSFGRAMHLRVTPTHIVIGRDGRIKYVGNLADKELDAALLAARAVPADHALAAATAAIADPPALKVGDSLPRKSLRTVDGRPFEFRPSVKQGGLTVLVFLSPWCESYLATTRPEVSAGCRNMRTQIADLSKDRTLRILGIASGLWANAHDLREYRAKYQVGIPITLDSSGGIFRTFRVNDVPTVLIADADGRLRRRVDAGSRDAAALRATIESVAGDINGT